MMLEVRGVKKAFGEKEILKGIDLQVEKGDVVAILGPSGSGKTTFLRCLNYLEKADRGTLIFDGQSYDLHGASRKDIIRVRQKTAFVFQSYNLFLNKTVLQNVTLGLISGSKMKKAEAREIAVRSLERVGMGDRLDSYPYQLSGGQQQRVAIARALVNNPAIILADEATGNLDTRTSFSILTLFQKLYQEGKTLIFVTHNPEISLYSSRNIMLKDGRIVSDEYNSDIKSAQEVYDNLPIDND